MSAQASSSARIFISYRRQDTAAYAAHLHDALSRRFGRARVFRDLDTIAPGQDYADVIERAISATTAVIVLIGPRWATIKGPDGARLDDRDDLLRVEIETALAKGVTVIPVLVAGAKMPEKKRLPPTIADLADLNAEIFSWHEDVARLGRQIVAAERERQERAAAAERDRLDLSLGLDLGARGHQSWATDAMTVVTKAMETSLQNQGHATKLSGSDLFKSLQKIAQMRNPKADIATQGYLFDDLVHVIDVTGVKATRSGVRYIARSYPLASRDEIVGQIRLRRPVLAAAQVRASWLTPPTSTDGRLVVSDSDMIQGGVVVAVLGWNPTSSEFIFVTPWPDWGDHGKGTMSVDAAALAIQGELRSIEGPTGTKASLQRIPVARWTRRPWSTQVVSMQPVTTPARVDRSRSPPW